MVAVVNLHQKQLEKITFDDVATFCGQRPIEDVRLDFKKALPKDLSKHFATFSNTQGGLIIIGIEEDSKTGLPLKWDGVSFDGKIYDQIHQAAANVNPFPKYKIHHTDEVKGKVFFVIKILPGDQPPYMTNKDTAVWVRTGNISTMLKNADARELAQMHQKSHAAEAVREAVVINAEELFLANLAELDKNRNEMAEKKGKEKPKPFWNTVVHYRITIMPAMPDQSIIDYRDLKNKLNDYRVQGNFGDFPDLSAESVPDGISFCQWRQYNDSYEFGLVLDNGLVFSVNDVQEFPENNLSNPSVYLGHLTAYLGNALLAARKLYALAGYNGSLICKISLSNVKGRPLIVTTPSGWTFYDNVSKPALKDQLAWDIEDFDTFKLADHAVSTDILVDIAEKIIWGFGGQVPNRGLIKDLLKNFGWKIV